MRLMRAWAFALVALAAAVQAAPPLDNTLEAEGYKLAGRLVDLMGIVKDIDDNTVGTFFAPTDRAVGKFLQDMGLSEAELFERKQLVDQVLSYHFVPGAAITDSEKAAGIISTDPKKPTTLSTADVDSYIRMSRSPATGLSTLTDMQGNEAVVVRIKPKMLGKVAIWPISAVLMSGSYFDNSDDVFRFYPELKVANELKQRAITAGTPLAKQWLGATASTFFVPTNDAFAGVDAKALVKDAAGLAKIFELHVVPGIKPIPYGFTNGGSVATLLPGASLKTTLTEATDVDPLTNTNTQVPELGVQGPGNAKPASVVIPNIYAGKSVVQVINAPLLPAGVSPPAAAKAASTGRKLLQGNASRRSTATQWSSQNTSRAIAAAARGTVPVSYATRTGSRNAQFANCVNCARWGTVF